MLKKNAKTLKLKEQIINDLVSELTITLRVTPSGEARLHIAGENLPFKNRDFQFDKEGVLVGTGTGLCYCKTEED